MKGWPEEDAGISLNSLLDVLFILLLFLMISLNLKPESFLDLKLPDVATKTDSSGGDPGLAIELSSDQQIYVKYTTGSDQFALAELDHHRPALMALCKDYKRVILRVDRKVVYEDFVQLLESLKDCEGADIAIEKTSLRR